VSSGIDPSFSHVSDLEINRSNAPQSKENPRALSLVSVLNKLSRSPRALVAGFIALSLGATYGSQEPSLPLHLQEVWKFNSSKVGLVFLAGTIPTIISTALAGYLTGPLGVHTVTFGSLLLAIPWWIVASIDGPLALFIVAFIIENFFTFAVVSPVTAELAAVAQDIDGVGYAHVYGVFTLAYGIGSTAGPVIGGQIYDHVKRGWMALCLMAVGLLVVSALLSFFFLGSEPLARRVKRFLQNRAVTGSVPEDTALG